MLLRKRNLTKLSSGKTSSKMIIKNNEEIIEIELWVSFNLNHDSGVEQHINLPQLIIK